MDELEKMDALKNIVGSYIDDMEALRAKFYKEAQEILDGARMRKLEEVKRKIKSHGR